MKRGGAGGRRGEEGAGGQRQEDGGGDEEAEGRAKVSKFFNFLNCQG